MRIQRIVVVAFSMTPILGGVAGEFLNLDFELAKTNTVEDIALGDRFAGYGPTKDLLPGWTVTAGNVSSPLVNFDLVAECCALIPSLSVISDAAEAYYPHIFAPPPWITGEYLIWVSTAKNPLLMSQVGDIPPEATELKLYTRRDSGTYLRTYLNDTEILDGDISAFSGMRNVKLTLEFGEGFFSGFTSPYAGVDRIEIVPEPSTWCLWLLAGGGAVIFARTRRKGHSNVA